MFRHDLSWNGATLAERLAYVRDQTARVPAVDDRERPAEPHERLAPWARAAALGDVNALRRRLTWDGIDVATAFGAVAVEAPAGFPVAGWVHRLNELMAGVAACAGEIGTPDWDEEVAAVGAEAPFADVWVPVLRAARRRLIQAAPASRDWLSDEAVLALDRQLIKEVSRLGELAVFEDFRSDATPSSSPSSSEGYQHYIRRLFESRWVGFLAAFPVLARQVVLVVDQWVEQTGTLVSRLADDRAAIELAFGVDASQVRRLTPGLSDRHAGGGRVAFVEFASGLRLAYKPRDVRLEHAFNEWLNDLRRAGLAEVPPGLRVLDRGTHGWLEWAEQGSPSSSAAVHAYFRSAGALACLAHVLGGTDLHSENLVATSDGPVLVDTEMLLQPSKGSRPASDAPVDDEDALGSSVESCLSSGLVSVIVVDRTGTPFDVGGLRPAAARELAVPMRQWLNLRRDDIQFVPEHRIHPILRNDVRFNGRVQRPEDFVDDVCAGFESAYCFLESNRTTLLGKDGPFREFAQCQTRVLFRPSDQYSAAQYLLAAPRYQRCGLDRSLAIETFHRVFIRDVARPRIWPLVHDERQAIEELDIPRQTLLASATSLEASTGELARDYYALSGVEAARGRLASLSADDLVWQIDQLRAVLGRHETASPVFGNEGAPDAGTVGNTNDERDLVAAAEQIGHALLGRAHRAPDGSLRWLSSRGRTDLYSGATGIGLFLGALAAVTGRGIWRDAAQQALHWIGASLVAARSSDARRIGACTGRPSVAYGVALAGHVLEDEDLIGQGGDLARTTSLEAIDTDAALDIEGGAAGALVALLAIHDLTHDDRLLGIARRCVSRLLATQVQTGPDRGAWRAGEDEQARPGFAHGAAGIAYALSRWAPFASDAGFSDVVHAAYGFERRVFADHAGAWPVVGPHGGRVVMAAWCHGAPGIALARACAPASLTDALVAGEIDAAMSQTLSASPAKLDHLCCGNLGRADVALTVGLRAGVAPWAAGGRAMARAVATRVLAQGRLGMRGHGFQLGATAPEFFQGLAGIGYQLLRTAAPSVLPSVLAFAGVADGPQTRRPIAREAIDVPIVD